MVVKTSIYYDIVTEYQNKGQKQAETGLAKLSKSALSLAKTYGVVFSGAALVSFGIKAVKAAADENKAFSILGNTLKNLGLGFASVSSKSFIENLSLSTGVAIDQLIPAYQNLLTATGDVALSQKDLQTAMDVSVGTGKDLVTVTQAMAKGYLGNTTGLMRLGAGLDKALVKTGRMDLIMKQLSSTFKGSAATAANTAAGSMARLGEAAHLATVAIGEGLMYAFDSLSNGTSVKGATSSIVDFGTAIGNAIKGVGDLITKIKGLVYLGPILGPLLKGLAFIINKTNPEILITKGLGQIHASTLAKVAPTDRQVEHQLALDAAAQKKVLANKAAQLASEKAILATQKAQTLAQQQQALLKILGSPTTDFERANIMAALQHAQTQDVKDQLQYQLDFLDAQTETGTALNKTIGQMIALKEAALAVNDQVMLVDGSIVRLSTAKNPFAGFPDYVVQAITGLDSYQTALAKLLDENIAKINAQIALLASMVGMTPQSSFTLNPTDWSTYQSPITNQSDPYAYQYQSDPFGVANQANVTITIDPGLIATTTQSTTANGQSLTINRTNNSFGSGF